MGGGGESHLTRDQNAQKLQRERFLFFLFSFLSFFLFRTLIFFFFFFKDKKQITLILASGVDLDWTRHDSSQNASLYPARLGLNPHYRLIELPSTQYVKNVFYSAANQIIIP